MLVCNHQKLSNQALQTKSAYANDHGATRLTCVLYS